MAFPRVIPVLLLKNKGLYKGVNFKNHKYIGDPINTVRIFNDKEADEIVILDIEATIKSKAPDYVLLEDIASEAFMPIAYGGGVVSLEMAKKIFRLGVEKIILGTSAIDNENLIKEITDEYGSQSVVVSVDVKKSFFGKYLVYKKSGLKKTKLILEDYLANIQQLGAGEILLNCIDNDGMQKGYDIELIKKINANIKVPLIISGGAWDVTHLEDALKAGVDSVGAGSMFVYQGPQKAVLITYLKCNEIENLYKKEN
jgi:imidazole glycerol-phosphate synthase subunit HisF